MASEYNITFLYNFMQPDGGASFSIDTPSPHQLTLTKEKYFDAANADTETVLVKNGAYKAKRDADRAYLHYVIDCWLAGEPVTLGPSEI